MQFNLLQVFKLPVVLIAFLAISIGLSGCAGSDVELNLPGLKGVTLGGKKTEKKVAARSGLVIPPSTTKLPDPDQVAARAEAEEQAWPDDPDVRRRRLAKLKKQEEKQRRKGLDKNGNPDFEALQDGGAGNPGILDKLLSGDLFGNKSEEDEDE